MELLIISKKNLFKNKITAGLTVSLVGLVMCCLILLLAINGAGKREIVKRIKEGGNLDRVQLDVRVFTEKGIRGKAKAILSPGDLQLIKNRCRPHVKEISFETVTAIIEEIRIGNKQYFDINPNVPDILGIPPEYIKVMDIRLKEGRFINKTDMLYKRRVCVLGGEVAKVISQAKVGKLVGKELITQNPDGKFTIIGVLHKKMPLFTALSEEMAYGLLRENNVKTGRKMNAVDVNSGIYIPFTTWQDWVKGRDLSRISIGGISLESETIDKSLFTSDSLPPWTFIWIKIDTPFEEEGEGKLIKDEENSRILGEHEDATIFIPQGLKESLDTIRKVLRKKYGEDKYFLFTHYGSLRDELNDQIEDSNNLLGIIFLSSLFLSSIILTSFMLLSVHKRTSEIGVCRAIGARKKDIFLQFLVEGVIIYSVGIMIGLVVGILVSWLVVNEILSWEFSIPIYGIIISSIFVFLVGLLSSLYPAIKAAKIQPAVAVKYE